MSRRLSDLRKLMADHSLGAYVVPHQDPHNSEYLAASDERVAFLSGFDGSAGTCVVTPTKALLWTDGRYFNQALQQLSSEWTLMKDRVEGTPKISDFLLDQNASVGIDPLLTSVATHTEWVGKKIALKPLSVNLVDKVWGSEKPGASLTPIRELALEFTGQSRLAKLGTIREEMKKESADLMLVCSLDEVAWLTNLRGCDIDYNPLFMSYLSVGLETAVLFVEEGKVSADLKMALLEDKMEVRPYTQFLEFIGTQSGSKVWIDPDTANLAVLQAISGGEKVEKSLPIGLLKSCKNPVEIAGARACHIRDGAAETKWLCWLSTVVMNDPEVWKHHTEVTLADKLEDYRKEMDRFEGLSFPSISSFGPNAAIIHYHARPGTCASADPDQIFLIDSGAQYLDGTTDVTRTVHFGGTPTPHQKDAFTRVLKGVIQLTLVKFPPGTVGPALDVLARQALWQNGLDFRHGTGHGVGSYLCVHEGPQGISPPMFSARSTALKTALKPGMILSNEPGYYEDGNFGIRIENLMTVVESDVVFSLNKGQKMLTFDTLTMIPIQRGLIEVDLMTDQELGWLNEYHAAVLRNLTPFMTKPELEWLVQETAPLVRGAPASPPKRTRSSSGKK